MAVYRNGGLRGRKADSSEAQFHQALLAAIEQCKALNYTPTYSIRMIQARGPFGAVRKLLDAPEVSEGF